MMLRLNCIAGLWVYLEFEGANRKGCATHFDPTINNSLLGDIKEYSPLATSINQYIITNAHNDNKNWLSWK